MLIRHLNINILCLCRISANGRLNLSSHLASAILRAENRNMITVFYDLRKSALFVRYRLKLIS